MVDRDIEKLESLYTANENVKCITTLENSLAVHQKVQLRVHMNSNPRCIYSTEIWKSKMCHSHTMEEFIKQ